MGDQGRPPRWPRFLPMIRPPGSARLSVSGRSSGQPHVHDPGLTIRRMGVHFCAPRRRGQHDPVFYEAPPPRWRVDPRCEVVSWLIVRPSTAGEPAHGAPLSLRAPGLEAPADLAGRAHPGAGPGTGPQNRVGIEGALLGTGAPTCGHAPRFPASDRRRGPTEHPGDARLTTQTPPPHRPQPGPTHSKTDDNPHPPPLNQETGSHPTTRPFPTLRREHTDHSGEAKQNRGR